MASTTSFTYRQCGNTHPIWSGSDTRVTIIQDNSVTLGGFNGLNN